MLSATQITNNSVGIDDTLAVDYNLKVSATTLQVGIDSINFVPAAANLNAAQSQIGAYLQSIWHAGNAAPDIGALLSTLAGLQSPAAYGQILSALNPNPAQTQNTVGMVTSLAFASSLMSCPGAPSADQSLVEHDCVWLRATTDSSGQNDPNSASSFHATGPRIQGGWQKQLMPDWFLGLSAAYDNQAIRAGALTAIFQDQIHVGAVVKWETLPWTFAAALTYTHGWSDMSRDIPTPIGNNVAASSTAQDMLDAKLRASDLYKFDDFYLRPSADIDIYYLHAGGYSETGAGAFNVIANASDKAMASGALGLEAGWFYTTPDGLFVRPYLSAGLTAFSDGQWDMSGRFQGAGAGTPNFSLASHFPDVLARSALGLESNLGDGTLRLEYENRSGARYHDNSVSVKMEGRF